MKEILLYGELPLSICRIAGEHLHEDLIIDKNLWRFQCRGILVTIVLGVSVDGHLCPDLNYLHSGSCNLKNDQHSCAKAGAALNFTGFSM